MTAASVRAIGPAGPWFCECPEWGWNGKERVESRVMRTPKIMECPVCHAVAPWAERIEASHAAYVHPLTRNDSLAARLRWWLPPWLAYAWRYREDFAAAPYPGRWYHACWGSFAFWLDRALDRLPSGALWPPIPDFVCDCDYCRGVPGARFEP